MGPPRFTTWAVRLTYQRSRSAPRTRAIDDSGTVPAGAGKLVDLSRPACLLLGSLVHSYEPDAARGLVRRYVSALAPGSYVVLTSVGIRPGPVGDEVIHIDSAGSHPVRGCPVEEVMSYLHGRDTEPETADTRQAVYGSRVREQATFRTREDIARFFEGSDLIDPGLVWATEWRPDSPADVPDDPSSLWGVAGIIGKYSGERHPRLP